MKKLLNTLYVLTPESDLFLRNETIGIRIAGEEKVAVPAVTIDSVVCFGKMSVSTPLLAFCAEHGISVNLLSERGRYYGHFNGPVSGNVLLRKKQYDSLNDVDFSACLVRDILYAKIRNSRAVLMRHARTSQNEETSASLYESAVHLGEYAQQLTECVSIDAMRGIEGVCASTYFSQFDRMLRDGSSGYQFVSRCRRPPANEVNAVLSFVYSLLTGEMRAAMETVGLDPAAGYLHVLRPGRPSLALDFMEELRAPLCDRFTLAMFNKGQLSKKDFETDSHAVYLNDKGRRTVLQGWQKRKFETIQHPFLNEKLEIGLIPYVQAMLFARVLRGDLDQYPPFVWR